MWYFYLFNIIVNSALSFFTAFILMSLGLFIFHIKHPRIKSICYALPFIKPFIDIFLYDFSSWALPFGLNPNIADKGSRFLSAVIGTYPGVRLQFSIGELDTGWTYSIADVLALKISPFLLKMGCLCILCISLGSLALFFMKWSIEKKALSALLERSSLYRSRLGSFFLSSEVSSPCASFGKVIFPCSLKHILLQEEKEAVLAHEYEHIRWKDSFLRMFVRAVSSFFWWIPMGFLEKKIEREQELAADLSIYRLGISKMALATAMLKVAKHTHPISGLSYVAFTGKGVLSDRVEKILKGKAPLITVRKSICTLLLAWLFLYCLLGKLWIF